MHHSRETGALRGFAPVGAARCIDDSVVSRVVMEDPVVAADGHSYERDSIVRCSLQSPGDDEK